MKTNGKPIEKIIENIYKYYFYQSDMQNQMQPIEINCFIFRFFCMSIFLFLFLTSNKYTKFVARKI